MASRPKAASSDQGKRTTGRPSGPRLASTKEMILDAAFDLFLSQGIEATSFYHIAERVGVTAPAIYKHYANKEEIGRDLFRRHYADLAKEVQAAFADDTVPLAKRVEGSITRLAAIFDRDPRLFSFLLMPQREFIAGLENDPEVNVVEALVQAFRRAGIRDAGLACAVYLGTVTNAALMVLFGRSLEGTSPKPASKKPSMPSLVKIVPRIATPINLALNGMDRAP